MQWIPNISAKTQFFNSVILQQHGILGENVGYEGDRVRSAFALDCFIRSPFTSLIHS